MVSFKYKSYLSSMGNIQVFVNSTFVQNKQKEVCLISFPVSGGMGGNLCIFPLGHIIGVFVLGVFLLKYPSTATTPRKLSLANTCLWAYD